MARDARFTTAVTALCLVCCSNSRARHPAGAAGEPAGAAGEPSGASGQGGAGGETPDAGTCSNPENSLRVVLQNDRDEPLYSRGDPGMTWCEGDDVPLYQVRASDGTRMNPIRNLCGIPCFCIPLPMHRIDAHGAIELVWDRGCLPDGAYSVSARAWAEASCGASCACVGNDSNPCLVDADPVGDEILVTVDISLPEDDEAILRFE